MSKRKHGAAKARLDGPPAIELERVTIAREGRTVVDGVSLAVEPGTIHLVIGPNGAGKSTLLSAVLGQTPFRGQIRTSFRGNGVVGYVPQTFVADRTLPITIAEFLALGRQRWPVCLGISRGARARIGEILERVGLAGMERRRIGELSGGELRRVLIGNAIDPAPELLLCDEPATGLDPDAVLELDETLVGLRADSGTTVLMVSHDRAQIRRIADRVTLLHVKVQRTGTADEVLGDAASERALS
ncbi:MAG: metal ABC transporter ATP-binding protein [Deltaproteobacteria bacterium]|nr:metal ABC transporter ATP-binding protein [Deltaproteobacteria bacterium]MCW5805691.1 metal ABC transporter ATP-binding protein [Deltaproteobacteria bacterium]